MWHDNQRDVQLLQFANQKETALSITHLVPTIYKAASSIILSVLSIYEAALSITLSVSTIYNAAHLISQEIFINSS